MLQVGVDVDEAVGAPAERYPELDGLRGIAIALVVGSHYVGAPDPGATPLVRDWLEPILRAGWIGVELFFVLSGFLIGGIIDDHRTAPNFLRVFYWRRVCRVLPAYLLALTASVLLPLALGDFLRGTGLDVGSFPVWSYFLFVQNIVMAANGAWSSWGVSWSLAVEEQFYLIIPALFLLFRARVVPLLLVLGLAAPVARFLLPNPITAYVLPFSHADSLFAGVLLALLVRRNPLLAFRLGSSRALVAGFLALFLTMATVQPSWKFEPMRSLGIFVLALTSGVLVLHARSGSPGVSGRILRCRPLGWLGGRSYFIYLTHTTVLIALHGLFLGQFPRNTRPEALTVTLISLLITLVAAEISWRLVEAPSIRFGRKQAYEPGRTARGD
jgi:peptidoglycan/LPS O-acetylase OafA/YrhL